MSDSSPQSALPFGLRSVLPRHRHELRALDIVGLAARFGVNRSDTIAEFFREHLGCANAALFPSGRGAIYWALRAAEETTVYVPAYTCYAVVEAAVLADKRVVFVDVNPDTYNSSAEAFAERIEPGGIVMATSQFGYPCDMAGIVEASHARGCRVMEDCAGGLGGQLDGKAMGAFGDVSIFSFEHTKTASAWNAGLLAARDGEWFAKTMALWRAEGDGNRTSRVEAVAPLAFALITWPPFYGRLPLPWFLRNRGMTGGVPEAAAAPVRETYLDGVSAFQTRMIWRGLERLDAIRETRSRIAAVYRGALEGLTGIILPPEQDDVLPIRYPLRIQSMPKAEFYARMLRHGVDLGFSFNYSCVAPDDEGAFPGAATLAREVINLPFYSRAEPHAGRVAEAVKRAVIGTE